jgi:phosphatidylserine/phosphatidylglycerophosphate/cardiolipin synthase-like enzyme
MQLDDWFLTESGRGNPHTEIDRRHGDGSAWTKGNRVTVLIDGASYFARLHEVLCATGPGDWVYFTDWQGDPDEQLDGPGTAVGEVFAELARRAVNVRGLLWRSHPEAMSFGEEKNLSFSRLVNEAGGEVLLDHRVRRGGSHHQKIVVVRGSDPAGDIAFVGGIDLCHGRRDDPRHLGDPQVVDLDDEHYGQRPPWHDSQLELQGPSVDDVAFSFAERWSDPTPLDSRNPMRAALHLASRHPARPGPLGPARWAEPNGPHAVQVLRTYPARRQPYPFAPEGERSVARAYIKAFRRARRLIYLEDQYLWSVDATRALRDALAANPDLLIAIVIPRYPDPDGALAGEASRIGRERVLDALFSAGRERVAVYDVENAAGDPIYVHSKVCIVDDVWMVVGSDNLNRRSWTHDSELSCAVIDTRRDERSPRDPGGLGDGARLLARDTRIRLAAEHLGRAADDVDDLVDPASWFDAFRAGADALDGWHHAGAGTRPPGHLRAHPVERVRGARRWGRGLAHRLLLDPDGRPRRLRQRDEF